MHMRTFVLFWVSLIGVGFNSALAETQWQTRQVLILHSYDASYQWTQDMQRGVEKAIDNLDGDVRLSVEYLDTKRISSPEYLQKTAAYLSEKYKNYHWDGILVTDDNAFRFVQSYFPAELVKYPIVAVAINDLDLQHRLPFDNISVTYERDLLDENLDVIHQLRPNIKKLYYLADKSITSDFIRLDVRKAMEKYPDIELVDISDKTLDQAAEFLTTVERDDGVLLTHYNTELEQGIFHSYKKIANTVGSHSQAPVFVLWELYLGQTGIVGGYVNRSEKFGINGMLLLAKKMGFDVTNSQSMNAAQTPIFQYDALEKYGIEVRQLPKNAVIVNQPVSYISRHLHVLLISGVIIVSLSLVIAMQFMTIQQKKLLNLKNRKIVMLQKRTLSVQKEMIHVLGEAIETRSGETGNHVKRVAQLSVAIGRLCGLSHRELEMLEIVSPMHDVGKIAVPEAILDKPGRLTQDERVIMQTHCDAGHRLLNNNKAKVMKLAAIVAYEHHEHWDGNGYPNGIRGEQIHIFSRITAIADVFDALLSERCYKAPWELLRVVAFFEQQKGKQFDPQLTDLLLKNIEDFVAIRLCYPDVNESLRQAI
ncbi:TPA: HD domain-containing protein [Vibrio vulnificus]|nr:HD domain-containing protein [Vibrio vulnificus]